MIPDYVQKLLDDLTRAGHEVFIVGGSVRDLLLGREVKDWDLTTSARPEQIIEIIPDSRYENMFGTVIVPIKYEGELLAVVEITTYRSEQGYSDHRRPDKIIFEDKLDKDLARRDFTINAMALADSKFAPDEDLQKFVNPLNFKNKIYQIIDLFGGQKDLGKKIIRAVGEPSDRFKEDALRLLRAVRFACQLDFTIEDKTKRGMIKFAGGLKFIAAERIKDELIKILASDRPAFGIELLHATKLLQYILPELNDGVGMAQNGHHIYSVFEHCLLALKNCPNQDWQVRLAALLHDVGKPKTKKELNGQATFYNHEYVGAKMTEKIMKRLRFSAEDSARVVSLVKNHMFYYQVDEVTAASVRRLIAKVGKQNLSDLIDLRVADRLGSGTPKAMPYKLRHLQYMMEKVQHDPVSVKMLNINGDILMKELNLAPGPKIGMILDVLLAEVIDEPKLNIADNLLERARALAELDLGQLRQRARSVIEQKREEEDVKIKKDFKVS